MLGVAIAAGVAALLVAPDSVVHPALIGLVALLCAVPIAVRAAQGRWDPFEPIVIISASCFVLFVMRPLWMWMNDEWIFSIYDARDGFTEAATVAVLGIGAVVAGYALPSGRRLAAKLPVIRDDWDPGRVTTTSLAVLVLAAFLFSFHIGTEGGLSEVTNFFSGRSSSAVDRGQTAGGARTTSGYFAFAPYMTIPIALILLEVWRRRRSPAAGAIAAMAIIAALAMTVPRGDRTWILALLMPLIMVPYLQRERRPRVVSIVAAIFLSVLAANILIEYRRKETRTKSLPALTSEAIADPAGQLDRFMLKADTAMFPALTSQVEATPDRVQYFPGQQLTSLIFAPVPGLLWRGKPQAPGNEAYKTLYGRASGPAALGGVAVSMFGSFFADFGLVAVVVYSLISGVLFRILFEYWQLNAANRTIGIVYAASLPILVMTFRASWTLGLGALLILIAPLIGIIWWSTRGLAPAPPPPAGAGG